MGGGGALCLETLLVIFCPRTLIHESTTFERQRAPHSVDRGLLTALSQFHCDMQKQETSTAHNLREHLPFRIFTS